jgi:2-keto-4-pentenoate hydratase/2-oxohepta-3-ene-1,7-dioic acid hydratase in catechol pathway
MIDTTGTLRDLSAHVDDIGPDCLAEAALSSLRALDMQRLPRVEGSPRYGLPFVGTRKFLAIGLNFSDHAAESNMALPAEPVLFTKAVSCLHGPSDPVMLPRGSVKSDWEVELGVVIGKRAWYVDERQALMHVAGYCVVNDLSEREYQLERSGTWDKGKGCDTFGPIGPWLVTADEVGDPQQLDMWLDVNGVRMQTGNTRTMVFGVATLVSYISRFMTLEPGDIVTTGTPPGVGLGRSPPLYLKPGDVMRLGIEKLGTQEQRVLAWSATGGNT